LTVVALPFLALPLPFLPLPLLAFPLPFLPLPSARRAEVCRLVALRDRGAAALTLYLHTWTQGYRDNFTRWIFLFKDCTIKPAMLNYSKDICRVVDPDPNGSAVI
jgi:hypothetical protein